jgi:hypothetical protein
MTTPYDHEHECSSCKRPFPHANYEDLPCTLATFTCDECQAKLDAEAEAKPQSVAESDDDEPAATVESAVDPPVSEDYEVEEIQESEDEPDRESDEEAEAKPQQTAHHSRARSTKKKKK